MPSFKYYELKSKFRTLKKSDVSPVYLFYGIEDYLKDETVTRLENILIEPALAANTGVCGTRQINEKEKRTSFAISSLNLFIYIRYLSFVRSPQGGKRGDLEFIISLWLSYAVRL